MNEQLYTRLRTEFDLWAKTHGVDVKDRKVRNGVDDLLNRLAELVEENLGRSEVFLADIRESMYDSVYASARDEAIEDAKNDLRDDENFRSELLEELREELEEEDE